MGLSLKLFAKRPKTTVLHKRYDVRIKAEIILMPREVAVEGMILNCSEGGCLFRPFQSHLINRTGDMVMVALNGKRLTGRIMNTNERGYGIAFPELVKIDWFGIR